MTSLTRPDGECFIGCEYDAYHRGPCGTKPKTLNLARGTMKVYTVIHMDYEDTWVASVWSSQLEAEKEAKRLDATKWRNKNRLPGERIIQYFLVEEYELDEAATVWKS